MSHGARIAVGTIVLLATSALLQAGGLETALRYDRAAIDAGQVWRVLSGNLVHLGAGHLALNAAGLALVALLLGQRLSLRAWAGVLLLSGLAVGLGLWLLTPGLRWYVGLSGILHGLFAAGAAHAVWRGPERGFHGLLIGALALKLGWEQFTGPLPGTAWLAGGAVIVDAHLFGTVGGLLAATLLVGLWHVGRP